MSFLTPWIALGLGAIVIPTLVILYFLKLRRKQELVPSTLLWKKAVQDLQVNAPFQRLRRNLLLLLQLLVLLAALFALARPIIETQLAGEESVILLIDNSASMSALEPDGETRLEKAKEQARRHLKTLNQASGASWFSFGAGGPKTRVMIVTFNERAMPIVPFTSNIDEAIRLVDRIKPTGARTRLGDALDLAEAYMRPSRGNVEEQPESTEAASRLVVLTDGAVEDLGERVVRYGEVEQIRIGETRDNVGITNLSVRRNYENPLDVDVFVQVRNFGPEAVTTDLSIYKRDYDDQGVLGPPLLVRKGVETLTLGSQPADEQVRAPDALPAVAGRTFTISPVPDAAVLEARVARDDAMAADNRAFAVLAPARRLKVLYVTEQDWLIGDVLNPMPVQWSGMSPVKYENLDLAELAADGRSRYDVVIFDKHDTSRLPIGNYLFFQSLPQLEGVSGEMDESGYGIEWWDETHPVLRNVSLTTLFATGLVFDLPPGAEIIAESNRGPVMARYSAGGSNFLLIGFAPEGTILRWFASNSFPILMYNALRYLGAGASELESGPHRPGDPLRIQLTAEADRGTLTKPDGETVELRAAEDGSARFAGTWQPGLYAVEPARPGRDRFAVNLEDPQESDITSRPLMVGGEAVAQADAIRTATPEIWRWFVGLAVVILLLEWYIYNRRVMI